MTKPYEVPPIHAAGIQLQWAIRLFLDHQAFVPAITLAGAARGMLEVLLGQQATSATAFASVKESNGFGTTDDIGKAINAPRNFLKHAFDRAFDANGADLQSMAISEIILATINLARLDKAILPETPNFIKWISENRPDMKERGDSLDTLLAHRFQEPQMTSRTLTRPTTELVHEGRYAAEVQVTLIEEEGAWSPYYSLEDAKKLDAVRVALRNGDLKAAAKLARVYELKPVAAE